MGGVRDPVYAVPDLRPQILSIPILILLLPRILFPTRVSYSAGRVLLVTVGFWVWANLHAMARLGVFLLAISWIVVWGAHVLRIPGARESLTVGGRSLPVLTGVQLLAVALAVGLTPNGLGVYW